MEQTPRRAPASGAGQAGRRSNRVLRRHSREDENPAFAGHTALVRSCGKPARKKFYPRCTESSTSPDCLSGEDKLMTKSRIKYLAVVFGFSLAAVLTGSRSVAGGGNEVNFSITDTPGRWFDTGVDIAGNRSLAVARPGVRVNF